MSDYYQECNAAQAYNINSNVHKRFGYIEYLRIGDIELQADIHVKTPVAGQKQQHVAVVNDLFWRDTLGTNPITFDLHLSVANQQNLTSYMQRVNFNSNVSIEFVIYDYDPNAGEFYPAFSSDKETVEGDIQVVDGGQLAIFVDREPMKDVSSPLNYFASLAIVPTAKFQRLISATSTTTKVVLPWGVKG